MYCVIKWKQAKVKEKIKYFEVYYLMIAIMTAFVNLCIKN